ncbi:branched-chain amino acid aminotransferase 2, chloroplastic isoform X2 [Lolium perenne]|uniref:branched-chain amino acid aminotransferase 2, chloroplastic isoform X2 n=1 Tax=Lolium perenne TaxID=4522 RepID=UPI0021F5C79A|nr:branched-chain amino acid aminotransferase 2, chloroplastic-like isoform X2 [Lolium perenne]
MELRLRPPASPASSSTRGTVVSPTLRRRSCSLPIQKQLAGGSISVSRRGAAARSPCSTLMAAAYNTGTADLVDFNWDTLGFQPVPTDFMYIMSCSSDGVFTNGELVPYGPIQLSPAAGVLNYGQGLLEGLRAHRKEDGSVILFRPEENALRMRIGADRLCMPAPSVEQFLSGVKQTVLANKRWVPPTGKGSLYIRPLLIGSGAILGVAPAPQYTFVVYVCPVGHYFKDGLSPISLLTEEQYHRAAPGGTGDIKTIGNYATVVSAQKRAKDKGHSDVLYLDPVHKKFVEEVSSCNIFMVKDNVIITPLLTGTILPGITRRSIIEIAGNLGFQVEERLIEIDELLDADEVFCTGTAVVLSPVGCIVYHGRRVEYGNGKVGAVSQQLYSALTAIQKGLAEDSMGWSVQLS